MTAADIHAIAVTALVYRLAISPLTRVVSRRTKRAGSVQLLASTAGYSAVAAAVYGLTVAATSSWLIVAVCAVSWRLGTMDFHVTRSIGPQWADRALLMLTAAGGLFCPPVLLAWNAIACGRLGGWQHHMKMPIRVIKVHIAWWSAVSILAYLHTRRPDSHDDELLLACCVALSHYLKPSWSKIRLGPQPWSWVTNNRTDHLIASAYAWGWARFVPERIMVRVIVAVRQVNPLLNAGTYLIECSGLVAFTSRMALFVVLLAVAAFNLIIAVCSGILFWENIVLNAALAVAIDTSDFPDTGWTPSLVAAAVMIAAALGLVWQPDHLGWWDTPFTARIHWIVHTVGGTRYGLHNNFMCPYERTYGRAYGYFLTSQAVVHGHLGIVWDTRLRDLVRAADGDSQILEQIKAEYGRIHHDPTTAQRHLAYLAAFFVALNGGARKHVLPKKLRWLKAPGGQLFYWGDLRGYRGGRHVSHVEIRYVERFYRDSTRTFVTIRDEHLHTIEIPTEPRASI